MLCVFIEVESSEFSEIECSEFSVRLRVLSFQWDWEFWVFSEIECSEFSLRLSVLSFQWDWVSWISPLDGVVQHWAVCVVRVHVHVLVDPPTPTQHVWTGVVCLSDGLQPKCVMLLYIAWTGVALCTHVHILFQSLLKSVYMKKQHLSRDSYLCVAAQRDSTLKHQHIKSGEDVLL